MTDLEHALTLNLADLLDRSLERFEQRPFLLGGPAGRTFGEIGSEVDRLAGSLAELGVGAGSRVAVLLPSRPEMLTLWLALARLGAAMVPMHPDSTLPEVRVLLARAGACGLVTDQAHGSALEEAAALPWRAVIDGEPPPQALSWSQLVGGVPRSLARPAPGQLVSLLFTSGTTGAPKGVRMTHSSFVLPALAFGRFMAVTPEDRFFGCLPLFHLAGQAFAASALAAGASIAVVERFRGSDFWRQVAETRATLVRYIGEMLAVLCKHSPVPGEREHTLRAVYGGGARPDVAEEFSRRFAVPVVEGYGLTETSTVLCNSLALGRRGSIGRALEHARVRIADDLGRSLPAGEVGEIQVERNAAMMDGYEGDPALTASVFVGDWFRTGDSGYGDEEGWFYFLGRDKDVVRRRGENVAASEVEGVLARHPAVALAAVVGVADDLGGEEIKAYLVLRPGWQVSATQLRSWCADSLAPFKVPRFLELCEELPMTPTHKVRKKELKVRGPLLGAWFDCREEAGISLVTS
ncbi:MAG TPA: AMP-binding protein [Thermoanaerobaculia bacterium]|nr:AMP-binding protein [Thermoanaerobaculia bacterium]